MEGGHPGQVAPPRRETCEATTARHLCPKRDTALGLWGQTWVPLCFWSFVTVSKSRLAPSLGFSACDLWTDPLPSRTGSETPDSRVEKCAGRAWWGQQRFRRDPCVSRPTCERDLGGTLSVQRGLRILR